MTVEQKKKILDAGVSLLCALVDAVETTDQPKIQEKENEKVNSTKKEIAEEKKVVELKQTYTKEEIREKLGKAAEAGISVRDIITPFIPEGKEIKFSNVPVSAYADVLKELENHAK